AAPRAGRSPRIGQDGGRRRTRAPPPAGRAKSSSLLLRLLVSSPRRFRARAEKPPTSSERGDPEAATCADVCVIYAGPGRLTTGGEMIRLELAPGRSTRYRAASSKGRWRRGRAPPRHERPAPRAAPALRFGRS